MPCPYSCCVIPNGERDLLFVLPLAASYSSLHTASLFRLRPPPYPVPPKEIASLCPPHAPIAPTAIPFSDSAPTRAEAVPQTRSPPRANAFAVSRAQGTSPRPTPRSPRLPPAPAAILSPALLPTSYPPSRFYLPPSPPHPH